MRIQASLPKEWPPRAARGPPALGHRSHAVIVAPLRIVTKNILH
jgi:hypothetical protein